MKKAFVAGLVVSLLFGQASLALASGRRKAYTRTGCFNVCVARSGSAVAVGNASSTVIVSSGGTTVVNSCKVSATSGDAKAVQNLVSSTDPGEHVVLETTPDVYQTGGCSAQPSSAAASACQGP